MGCEVLCESKYLKEILLEVHSVSRNVFGFFSDTFSEQKIVYELKLVSHCKLPPSPDSIAD